MRKLLCGLSYVLCIACIIAAFVEFSAKFNNPMEATLAMAFWVAWGWVFAIVNYVALPTGRPPPIDLIGKWRVFHKAVHELASVFGASLLEIGVYEWMLIIVAFMIFMSMIAPAVQNSRSSYDFSTIFQGDIHAT